MTTGITEHMLYQGKVRDVYQLEGPLLGASHPDSLLFVASDRISAFDVVLPTLIPGKGKVLNQISAFWFEKTNHILPNHLLQLVDEAWLSGIQAESPETAAALAPFVGRGMVVKQAERIDIECIVRGYIAGSAWREYKADGTVWGLKLPTGLKEGDLLEPDRVVAAGAVAQDQGFAKACDLVVDRLLRRGVVGARGYLDRAAGGTRRGVCVAASTSS